MKKKKLQYRNQKWHDLKEKVKKRDNCKCVECGRDKKSVVLQVHHLRYIDGDVWESPMDDLVTLCKSCHAIEHGIIEPNKGWILEDSYDNGDCSSICERDGCGRSIRHEKHIYHPKVGNKIVGSECVKHLTQVDQEIVKKITRITSSANNFIKKFTKSNYSLCLKRSGFYSKDPCMTAKYSSSTVDIFSIEKDNFNFLCLFWVGVEGSYREYSYQVKCDNINDCMRFSYYMIRGIKCDPSKGIELQILRTLASNYKPNELKSVQK